MFEKAINSFNRQIGKLSDTELDYLLSKYNPNNYSKNITLSNLDKLPAFYKSYHTKIEHAGWFNVSSQYFTEVSSFFTEVLENDFPRENFWYKDPPKEDILYSESELISPQEVLVGFLFKFV